MRPDTSSDPTVELVEEFSNGGALVILAPTPQNRIQLGNQLSGAQGHATLGPLRGKALRLPASKIRSQVRKDLVLDPTGNQI